MGILGGIPASMENLMFMVQTAKESIGDFEWSVCAAGRFQMNMCTTALLMGGHARVGLEDSLYLERGRMAKSNADQVEKIVRIGRELGIEPAALLVLHTWNQELEHHQHVHALVPGGGPSRCGEHWIKTRHPRHRRRRKPYLVDNDLLSERFRDKFLAGLQRLHHQGKLRLGGELAGCVERFTGLVDELGSRPWVVYIEAPPAENASPENVVKYLARYMTGGPISTGLWTSRPMVTV